MLLNKYWPNQDVTVVGSRQLTDLPGNVTVYVAGADDEPWTTRMHDFLTKQSDHHFVFLFDDYWLTAPVDIDRVRIMEDCVIAGAEKGDLSTNTAYFKHTTDINNPELVIAAQDAHYRSSTQPAIWNRKYMLQLLNMGRDPWQFELYAPAGNDGATIVGPREQIYVYANVYYKGQPDTNMINKISAADLNELSDSGALVGIPGIKTM
jgi:hypothetical protein